MLGINGGNSSTCFFIIYVFHTEMEAILSLFSPDSIIIQRWNIFVVIFFFLDASKQFPYFHRLYRGKGEKE